MRTGTDPGDDPAGLGSDGAVRGVGLLQPVELPDYLRSESSPSQETWMGRNIGLQAPPISIR